MNSVKTHSTEAIDSCDEHSQDELDDNFDHFFMGGHGKVQRMMD